MLMCEHLSNKEIASRLCIEVATVKNHVHNVLDKLNVHRRSDAVRLLARTANGFVRIPRFTPDSLRSGVDRDFSRVDLD